MSEENADLYVFDKESGELSAERRPPHGILPWPSYNWQRAGLFASIPLGLFLLMQTAFPDPFAILGWILLLTGIYTTLRTKLLRNVDDVSATTKGLTVFNTLWGLAAIGIVLAAIALVALVLWLICALLGGWSNSS